jgi:hypothetical protein
LCTNNTVYSYIYINLICTTQYTKTRALHFSDFFIRGRELKFPLQYFGYRSTAVRCMQEMQVQVEELYIHLFAWEWLRVVRPPWSLSPLTVDAFITLGGIGCSKTLAGKGRYPKKYKYIHYWRHFYQLLFISIKSNVLYVHKVPHTMYTLITNYYQLAISDEYLQYGTPFQQALSLKSFHVLLFSTMTMASILRPCWPRFYHPRNAGATLGLAGTRCPLKLKVLGVGTVVVVSCRELSWVVVSCRDLSWVVVTCRELSWLVVSCRELSRVSESSRE